MRARIAIGVLSLCLLGAGCGNPGDSGEAKNDMKMSMSEKDMQVNPMPDMGDTMKDMTVTTKDMGGDCSACNPAHGTGQCQNGKCIIAQCDTGWDDCNDDPSDGCEVQLDSDPRNCGHCSVVCSTNHASAVCSGGTCTGQCETGWSDCDSDKLNNGCEANVNSDARNCGSCGTVCSTNHIEAACTAGQCAGACETGWSDCDSDKLGNGCEEHTATDVNNCGSCGWMCPSPGGATPSCEDSKCGISNCPAGKANCDHDDTNGCEVDSQNDPMNCGSCGTTCPANNNTPACSSGRCGLGTCNDGYKDCDGNATNGCEINTQADKNNCGGCGVPCNPAHAAGSCTDGICGTGACDNGYGDCDHNVANGCEVNTQTDTRNCGGCGTICAANHNTPICNNGTCKVGTCTAGYQDCDGDPSNGCEVFTGGSDTDNCGACGQKCNVANGTGKCVAGSCAVASCTSGWGDCDTNYANGCEMNVDSSLANCGSCGNQCSGAGGTLACSGGHCGITCMAGYADCDSNHSDCETPTNSNPGACGGCGKVCSTNHIPSATCSGGACNGACATGFSDCNGNKQVDGCESESATDINNCGGCNQACSTANITVSCAGGSCNGACKSGYADCDGNKRTNGCEINLNTDAANCGACGHSCQGGTCLNGACQPVLLAKGTDNPHFMQVALDANNVYWTDAQTSSGDGRILKVSKNGGTVTTIARYQSNPYGIAVDGTMLYWINSGAPMHLMSASTSAVDGMGSVFATCSGFQWPINLALDSANIYIADHNTSGYLWKISKSSKACTPLASHSGSGPVDVAITYSGKIAWTNSDDGTVRVISPDGTNEKVVASGRGYPYGITAWLEGLYWAEQSGKQISLVGSSGGTVTNYAAGQTKPGLITSYTGTSNYVAWVDGHNSSPGTIKIMKTDGSGLTTIASGISYPFGISTDGKSIFFLAQSSVYKVALPLGY